VSAAEDPVLSAQEDFSHEAVAISVPEALTEVRLVLLVLFAGWKFRRKMVSPIDVCKLPCFLSSCLLLVGQL